MISSRIENKANESVKENLVNNFLTHIKPPKFNDSDQPIPQGKSYLKVT